MKQEYWDLYHLDGTHAGVMQRGGQAIPPDLYHVTVEIIPTDRSGHMLVTRRSLMKQRGGGNYEFPAGSVLAGEAPADAAARELFEETGLTATTMDVLAETLTGGMKRVVYLAYIQDLLNASVILQPEETMDYKFVTVPQWLSLVGNGQFEPSRVAMYTEHIYQCIEAAVGKCKQEEPKQTAPKKWHPSTKLTGTRSGLSGQDSYHYAIEERNFPKQQEGNHE